MPADLVGGAYHLEDPVWKILGRPANATQGNVAVRSNLWATGLSTLIDQATAATKKGIFAAIPVQYGDSISKVTVLVGATAGKTAITSFVALYSGALTAKAEGLLLGQSKAAEVELKASKPLTETLEKSVLITPTNAPNGYIYAGLIVQASTINTQVGVAIPTACQKEWFTGCPEAWAVTGTQTSAGVASATLKIEGEAAEKTPLIFLS